MKFGEGILWWEKGEMEHWWMEHLKSLGTECSGSASEGAGWPVKAIKGRQRIHGERQRRLNSCNAPWELEDSLFSEVFRSQALRKSQTLNWVNPGFIRVSHEIISEVPSNFSHSIISYIFPNSIIETWYFFFLIYPSIRDTSSFHWHYVHKGLLLLPCKISYWRHKLMKSSLP